MVPYETLKGGDMTVAESAPRPYEIVTVPGHQAEIPLTSRDRYITDVYALNVQCPEDTTGDWHDVYHWREGLDRPRTVTLGGSDEVDTNHIYGDLGVYEGLDRLKDKGLEIPRDMTEAYIANHYRAILDMLYSSLTTYGKIYNLTGATVDWLDTREQQAFVLEQAAKMLPHLPEPAQAHLNKWAESEIARF